MRAWISLLFALALATTATALPLPAEIHQESFETGWGAWSKDHHVQCEDDGSCTLDWSSERTLTVARTGTWSIRTYIDGNLDDGVVWAEATFPVDPTPTRVGIQFHILSTVHSDVNNWDVVGYVGPKDPEREEDFTVVGITDRGVGWQSFCHEAIVTPDAEGNVHAAFGVSVTWETPRTYYLDDVLVQIGGPALCDGDPLCKLIGALCGVPRP